MQQQNRANLLFSNITSGQFSSRFWIRCYLDSSIVLVHITKLHVDQCHAFQYILITIWIMPRYILFPPFIIFCLIFLMTRSKLLLSNSNACMRKAGKEKSHQDPQLLIYLFIVILYILQKSFTLIEIFVTLFGVDCMHATDERSFPYI